SFAIEGGHVLTRHPCAVRHRAELGAGFRLRVFDHLRPRPLDKLETEFFHQTEIALGANVVAGNHRLQIEPDILRIAAHAGQSLKHVFARLASLAALDSRSAHTL